VAESHRSGTHARILFVDHTPVAGGAELVLATHIAALDRTRFEPLVACTETVPMLLDRYRASGADVHIVPMPRLRRLSPFMPFELLGASRRLRQLIREQRAELVVANTSRAAYIAAVALVGMPVPLVWWVRDFLFGGVAFRLLKGRATRIICVSHAVREFYGGRADPRFSVVHVASSLDEELPSVTGDRVRHERVRWGFTDDDIVVGFMGRLVDDKGPEDVVDAVALAHAQDSRIKLLVAGSGRGQQGDVEEALHSRVRERGLDCVVFAGFQGAEALYYTLFDIFVLATRTPEPYATSVVQAMMAGTPVVATATGGTPELVRPDVTGLLVPPGAPRQLADAILRLADDAGLRRRLTTAARGEVLANNRERTTTPIVEAIYDEALATSRR
jgi:glycosyltransferase involved in cell wall biosynthesis